METKKYILTIEDLLKVFDKETIKKSLYLQTSKYKIRLYNTKPNQASIPALYPPLPYYRKELRIYNNITGLIKDMYLGSYFKNLKMDALVINPEELINLNVIDKMPELPPLPPKPSKTTIVLPNSTSITPNIELSEDNTPTPDSNNKTLLKESAPNKLYSYTPPSNQSKNNPSSALIKECSEDNPSSGVRE